MTTTRATTGSPSSLPAVDGPRDCRRLPLPRTPYWAISVLRYRRRTRPRLIAATTLWRATWLVVFRAGRHPGGEPRAVGYRPDPSLRCGVRSRPPARLAAARRLPAQDHPLPQLRPRRHQVSIRTERFWSWVRIRRVDDDGQGVQLGVGGAYWPFGTWSRAPGNRPCLVVDGKWSPAQLRRVLASNG